MTKDEIHRISAHAKAYSYSKGLYNKELQEDFAQEVLLYLLQGRKLKWKNFYADFLRKLYGRTDRYGTPASRAKSFALRTMHEYLEDPNDDDTFFKDRA